LATNYDGVAAVYDTGRVLSPEVFDRWLDVVESHVSQPRPVILDLGCGTGRFSIPLARRFGGLVAGVDPSRGMLQQARTKGGDRVRYVQGRGERIPLRDGSVHLVFASMVFHHLASPRAFAAECARVLAPGCAVFVRTGIVERAPFYPQSEFFPASLALMEQRLPSVGLIRDVFAGAGFAAAGEGVVTQEIGATWNEFADRTATRADSVLRDLDDRDFNAGMAALRRKAQEAEGPVTETIDFFVFANQAPTHGA
jgi:ubiquinone/menaquinone biosynthesis C-methylase UbiE